MKRKLLTALCSVLAVAMTVPAFADHQIGGYYRMQMIMDNIGDNSKDADPTKVVDHRFRARWQNNINEYVSVVWFGEVDTVFGSPSKGGIGSGGRLASDGVNVETKHAYLDLKIPETPVAFRTGMQGYGGNFDGVILNDDFAAVLGTVKTDMVAVTALWGKWAEGDFVAEDDTDIWTIALDLMPIGGLKLGLEGYWINNNSDSASIPGSSSTGLVGNSDNYFVGVRGGYNFGMVDVKAWIAYNFGTNNGALPNGDDQDISALAASVKGAFKIAGAKAALRLIYVQNDDDDKDDMSFNGGGGAFEMYDDQLQIFLADVFYNNTAGGRRAFTDAAYAGYGLFGAVLSGSYSPPAMKDLYAKLGLGYFMALDDKRNDEATASREGTSLGFEASAQVGIKVGGAADVSLRGAYAVLGDFYDARVGDDPDDIYKVALMVNVPY